jgi:hypothetical protein
MGRLLMILCLEFDQRRSQSEMSVDLGVFQRTVSLFR